VFDFEYAVLVGAGIGSTPAASILKHIKYRLAQVAKTGERCQFCKFKLKKLYFVWSNRDAGAFRVLNPAPSWLLLTYVGA